MLVEDSAKVREMTKSLLSGLGAEFVECADGREALAAYRQHQPDWVLMDILMSEVDGLTATRQITVAFPEARALVVTQFDSEHLRAAARAAGACGYVLKENLLEARQIIEAQTLATPSREPAKQAILGNQPPKEVQ
jgi:CheY-like chemotaxis protein